MTSPEQADDLADAISGVLHDELATAGGGMVTAYHLVAEFVDADGAHRWLYATSPDQPLSTTMGLLEWSRGVATHEQRRYLDGLD